ncbi:hypothetical protein TWF696_009479 [Orbilia brochopaga]|uniref:Uncharacterized protein n=1 Tax=Orbilia brochopaga TaxID=3140254 RepID=A0AAV9UBH4_9PEZI
MTGRKIPVMFHYPWPASKLSAAKTGLELDPAKLAAEKGTPTVSERTDRLHLARIDLELRSRFDRLLYGVNHVFLDLGDGNYEALTMLLVNEPQFPTHKIWIANNRHDKTLQRLHISLAYRRCWISLLGLLAMFLFAYVVSGDLFIFLLVFSVLLATFSTARTMFESQS